MNFEGRDQRRYVRPSDRRLAEVATQAAARIDLETLLHRRSETAGVMTERSVDGTAVTTTCVIECSLIEMQTLLVPPTSDRYASVMRELVGQDFIYGTIVHRADAVTTQNVSVRTVTFQKRHLLARNEQLCFVSAVQPLALCTRRKDVEGFTVTLASLDPDDVFTGKAQAASVTHLHGMSALYLVTPEVHRVRKPGRTTRAVRVTFCANVASPSGSLMKRSPLPWPRRANTRGEADSASNRVVLARAVQFARTLKQYNVAVRRRRLDAQVLADLQRVQPSNTRCACCTRRISVTTRSRPGSLQFESPGKQSKRTSAQGPTRCQLCAFLVCARCVCTVGNGLTSTDSLAMSSTSIKSSQTVHLCEHCMQRVDDADYDNYCSSTGTVSPTSAVQPDCPGFEPPSAVIARVLSQVLATASCAEKPVVVRVIKYLLSAHPDTKSKFRATSAELTKRLGRLAQERGLVDKIDVPKATQEGTLEGPPSPLDDERPALAGSSGRQYALQYTDLNDLNAENSDDTDDSQGTEDTQETDEGPEVVFVSQYPVPADESDRLQWLTMHPNVIARLIDLPDLELLCHIALAAIQCDAAVVTVFGAKTCYVVASTDPAWRRFESLRSQVICGHTLMTAEPLLLHYPEADVRFSAMDIVRRDGVRFYFGFPVQVMNPESAGLTTIGTFCCVQMNKTRNVSESQYALMATLVQGINRVFEYQASDLFKG